MTATLALILSPFVLLTTFFAIEVSIGIVRDRRVQFAKGSATAAIIVPAHDEGAVISQTLESLESALDERMYILVVADNCSDDTADRARRTDHQVVERTDQQHRGKGFALAFAAAILENSPPDVVVVIDADCEIDSQSLRAIVDESAASQRPCQAVNLLRPCVAGPPLVQISTFAFFVKNSVRQRGLQRLAGRVHLTGTGMAIPYSLFKRSDEVRDSVVEDLAFGLKLADDGHPAKLVDRALVWSDGSTETGTLMQRRRWEGGFLSVSLRRGWGVVGQGLSQLNARTVLAGLDLLVPPLALFTAMNMLVLMAAAVTILVLHLSWWPFIAQALSAFFAFAAVGAVWLGEGRKFLSGKAMLQVPIYVLWKLPLYMAIARRGAPSTWLRSGRGS